MHSVGASASSSEMPLTSLLSVSAARQPFQGRDAAILVQSASAALRRRASQWPPDEAGVPLKRLTDRWCQQHGEDESQTPVQLR